MEYLSWDSNFFNLKIYKVEVKNEDREVIARRISSLDFDLCYLFHTDVVLIEDIFTGGVFSTGRYDLLLEIKPPKVLSLPPHVHLIHSVECRECFKLAILAGSDSRFRNDPHFQKVHFERLYYHWISKSISGEIASYVAGVFDKDFLVGIVSLKIEKTYARIGLIAVNPSFQNGGYGTKLLDYVKSDLYSRGIRKLFVTTQDRNSTAIRFYEKNGFKLYSQIIISHIWKLHNPIRDGLC